MMREIRKEFPILQREDIVYLDNAATSQCPKCVIDVVSEFNKKYRANIGRSSHKLGRSATKIIDKSRETVADFIGAKPENIIFTGNTTEAINLIAYTYPWKEGDRIVTTLLEHHSNYLPWIEVGKRHDVDVEVVKPNVEDYNDNTPYYKSIGDDTTIFAITGMSNVLGVIPELNGLIDYCRERNTCVCIDGAQLAPHRKIDVRKLSCDFFAFSSYKICGPYGVGALYVRDPEILKPFMTGGGMIDNVEGTSFIPAETPSGFEAGTQPLADVAGFARALEFIEEIGWEKIETQERKLFDYFIERFKQYDFLNLHTPVGRGDVAPIFSFTSDELSPHQLSSMYDELGGIALRSGHMCALPLHREILSRPIGSVRASLSFYNSIGELDRFFEVTDRIAKFVL